MKTTQLTTVCTRFSSLSLLTRGLAAILLVVTSAGSVLAAPNYKPIGRNDYRPSMGSGGSRYDDSDTLFNSRGRARIRDFNSNVWDNDDQAVPFRSNRSRWNDSRGPFLGDDGGDSFGVTVPRGREPVPKWYNPDYPTTPSRWPDVDSPYSSPRRNREPNPSQSHNDDLPSVQDLISRRYQDPAVLRFIGSLSPDRALSLYGELLQLIQQRHLQPPAPQAIVQRGVQNLAEALQNPAFLQATRLNLQREQAYYFQQMLAEQIRQVQSIQDAVGALQMTMQIAQQQLGLSPSVVGVEFVYGAVESLDRFSAFVPPERTQQQSQQLGENVVGIGVQIVKGDSGVRIDKVMQGGPAAQAGLQKGDEIVAVDGRSIPAGDLDAATSLITGPEGTAVQLSILRNGRQQAQISLARQRVEIYSVTDVQMIDPSAGIGYMKLETFSANSTKEMEQALMALHQQNMKSLVLDLRGDPGGLLTTAIEVADLFLPNGTIVSTRGRNAADNTTETAKQPQTWKVPLVVLIDENSASASEILAAAIQDNDRGIIVGRHSYGKGTVQTLFPLQTVGASVRLTTAKFYSPSGREMAGQGVEPDVPVAGTSSRNNVSNATDRDIQAAVDVARRQGQGGGWDISMSGNRNPLGQPGRSPMNGNRFYGNN